MDFNKLVGKAQEIYTKRGGAEAAKGDAGEVAEIFKGEGSFADKARRAAKALKQPGASHDRRVAGDPVGPNDAAPQPGTPEPPSSSP